MFKKPVSSNPNSPFAKKKALDSAIPTDKSEVLVSSVNEVPVKKKLSFGKR